MSAREAGGLLALALLAPVVLLAAVAAAVADWAWETMRGRWFS